MKGLFKNLVGYKYILGVEETFLKREPEAIKENICDLSTSIGKWQYICNASDKT